MKELREVLIRDFANTDFNRKGYFHCFQNDADNEPIAICELENGAVWIASAANIMFVKKVNNLLENELDVGLADYGLLEKDYKVEVIDKISNEKTKDIAATCLNLLQNCIDLDLLAEEQDFAIEILAETLKKTSINLLIEKQQLLESLKNVIEIVEDIPNFDGIITRPNSIIDYQKAKKLVTAN